MSKVLYDSQPIVVDRTLAKSLKDLNQAIVLQQIHYWITLNKNKNINYNDGYYWTYNSIRKWHEEEFSFWSEKTVERAFKGLVDKGVLITGNYNRDRRDKTKWYTINYDILDSLVECIPSNCQNGHCQSDSMNNDKMGEPLPETFSEICSEIINREQQSYSADAKVDLFYSLYKKYYNKEHIKLSKNKVIEIGNILSNDLELDYNTVNPTIEEETLMIIKYFNTNLKTHTLLHYCSGDIRKLRYLEVIGS